MTPDNASYPRRYSAESIRFWYDVVDNFKWTPGPCSDVSEPILALIRGLAMFLNMDGFLSAAHRNLQQYGSEFSPMNIEKYYPDVADHFGSLLAGFAFHNNCRHSRYRTSIETSTGDVFLDVMITPSSRTWSSYQISVTVSSKSHTLGTIDSLMIEVDVKS